MIIHGDCVEEMKKLEENSIDVIVTDPPYGIGFMGKEWDNFKPSIIKDGMEKDKRPKTQIASTRVSNIAGTYDLSLSGARGFQDFCEGWSKEAMRILKPGGFMLVSCSTRMYNRMTCGIEDAGFEIRDTIMWLYGNGFPKSLNIGKQIDKIEGIEHPKNTPISDNTSMSGANYTRNKMDIQSDLGKQWEGWGTALKPACEPIVVARKPLSEKNVALNVLKWGTGGINIDECRIGTKGGTKHEDGEKEYDNEIYGKGLYKAFGKKVENLGRFPANIILNEEAGKLMPDESSEYDDLKQQTLMGDTLELENKSASRFFYCAKSSKSERNLGCEDMKDNTTNDGREVVSDRPHQRGATNRKNNHPTVKPIKLMEYLIKLVSKENALVLDPFAGSGSTLIACQKLNRKFIGIEKEEEYIKIINARLKPFMEQTTLNQPEVNK